MMTAWFNFKTEKYDYLETTPKDFSDYISQDTPAQAMYKLHQKLGLSPLDAAQKVLVAQLEKKE